MNFDPEAALEQHTLYSIQEISQELEFIATNVCPLLKTYLLISDFSFSLPLHCSIIGYLKW